MSRKPQELASDYGASLPSRGERLTKDVRDCFRECVELREALYDIVHAYDAYRRLSENKTLPFPYPGLAGKIDDARKLLKP
jgi:hypothetical protein